MTTMYLLTGHGDFHDNLRMLTNCGVKFAGRAVYQWGRENALLFADKDGFDREMVGRTRLNDAGRLAAERRRIHDVVHAPF